MAIVIESYKGEINAENIAIRVAEWMKNCEKTLDFVYSYTPTELSVLEALQGNPSLKICDPYGYISEVPLSKKVESIENENGKPVNKRANISGDLTVKLTTGEELSGRWVDGRREGQGIVQGQRLDKVGFRGEKMGR
eukprot:GFUD01049257.1.p1 GENE.GFUD01049257.1~~GFUD01049257.1.p1  ORF type:complete len:137 (+),score=30.47 GFUD01049257.1:31-441(+)